MQHSDLIGNRPHTGHVVSDGDCCCAHLGDNLADQLVDDARHNRIKARCGFVEKDHLRVGTDRTGKADALLHTARKLGSKQVCGFRGQPHAAQFFDGDLAGFIAGAGQRPTQQAKGDILPDGQAVKQSAALEKHPEAVQKGFAGFGVQHLSAYGDCSPIGSDQTKDAFQQHRFAGARAADHHHRLTFGYVKRCAAQHMFGTERFMDVA